MRRSPGRIISAFACLTVACGRTAPVPSIDGTARAYVRLAVALGERDPDSIDFYGGPAERVADVRAHTPTLAAIQSTAAGLAVELRVGPSRDGRSDVRRRFLYAQLRAVERRAALLAGARLSFDRESAALFGVVPPPPDEARLADVRSAIARLLPGAGSLADRYDAFERRFTIPPARLPEVMTAAIAGCRARTLAHEPLPPREGVTVEYVGNKPWGAFSRYQGGLHSLVQINADFAWTVDRALQVACHETYPGHHAWNVRSDIAFVRRGWTELAVQPSFSPESLVTEGGASLAASLAFPGSDLTVFERDVLFPVAGLDPSLAEGYVQVERLVDRLAPVETDMARRYLDGGLEFERAASALEAGALMAHPEAALKYINEFRTYVVTYTYGRDLAERYVDETAGASPTPDARWRAYERLADPAVMLDIVNAPRSRLPTK